MPLAIVQYLGLCPTATGLPGAWSDRRYNRRGATPPKNEGLSEAAINRLLSFSVHETLCQMRNAGEEQVADDDCLICQEEMSQGKVAQLPCGHIFHKKCISDWLLRKASCPTCRCEIKEEELLKGGSPKPSPSEETKTVSHDVLSTEI